MGIEWCRHSYKYIPFTDLVDVVNISEDIVVFFFTEYPLLLGETGIKARVGHVVVDKGFHGCQVFFFRCNYLEYRLKQRDEVHMLFIGEREQANLRT